MSCSRNKNIVNKFIILSTHSTHTLKQRVKFMMCMNMNMNANVVTHENRTMKPPKFNFNIYVQVDATTSTILSIKFSTKYSMTQLINYSFGDKSN